MYISSYHRNGGIYNTLKVHKIRTPSSHKNDRSHHEVVGHITNILLFPFRH